MSEQSPFLTPTGSAETKAGETAANLEKLKSYTRVKLAIAAQVRQLSEILQKRNSQPRAAQCQELMVKLAEDRFTLAVLGQFKRGKSSLMNAIIGRNLLPTGVLPLTSAITVLRYGPRERLVVRRAGWALAEEAPVQQLADFVTEKGNPGNAKGVETACVELPLPFLRRGLEFVDTPGVGSSIEANTATAYGFLPQCDAVLFVTSVEAPMTEVEMDFLRTIRQYVGKIFFAANKTDLLDGNKLLQVLEFTAATLRAHMGGATIRVFPVSSRLALQAKLDGSDHDGFARSGLEDLETDLVDFLTREKSGTFLAAMVEKVVRILDEESLLLDQQMAGLPRVASIEPHTNQSEWADPARCLAALTEIRAALTALRDEIAGREPSAPPPVEVSPRAQDNAAQPVIAGAKGKATQPDITRELRTRGCPVCRHIAQASFTFFSQWQYELAYNAHTRAVFADELGFCPLHAWHLSAISSPHGSSLGYPKLAERIANELAGLAATPQNAAKQVLALVRSPRTCRVCRLLHDEQDIYVRRLAAFLQDGAGRQTYARSQGVCLRHLALLADAGANADLARFLLTAAARRFEELAEDMQSFALKHDAIRRGLQNTDEEDAWRRTLVHLVGEAAVCVPRNPDAEI